MRLNVEQEKWNCRRKETTAAAYVGFRYNGTATMAGVVHPYLEIRSY